MILTVGSYTGEAALVVSEPFATLAHYGPGTTFVVGRVYSISNESWLVLSNTPSVYIPGVTNVRLRRYV